jgi:antitoxin (DNA-binding transcriptional repressor) of toxin-antitoxin stability system
MKTVDLSKASASLSEYVRGLSKGTIIVTSRKKLVAALIPLKGADREAIALSTDPKFLKLIEKSRRQAREGRTISLAEMKRKYGATRRR